MMHTYTVWGDNQGFSVFQDVTVSESLVPEEYHIVKNKGLESLEFYEEWVCPIMVIHLIYAYLIIFIINSGTYFFLLF